MRIPLMTPRGDPQGDDTGAVAIVVALLMTLIMVLAAFAVDIGSAYAQKRQLSVAADAASLAAAAAFGKAMLPGESCTHALSLGIAKAKAEEAAAAMNTANNKTVGSGQVDSVDVKCVGTNAIEVRVDNSRDVDTAIAGIIGISTITPTSYAVARYVRTKSVPGLRPWAVCDKTMQLARADAAAADAEDPPLVKKTFWTGIDWMPGGDTGPCSTGATGNWGAVDFDGHGNSATDLASWTLNGYPGSVQIGAGAPPLPADPGANAGGGGEADLVGAFEWLIGEVVPFPTVSGFIPGSGGNGAEFTSVGVGTVKVCGIVFGSHPPYNYDQSTESTSDCWVDPSEPTTTTETTTQSTTTSADMPKDSLTLNILLPSDPLEPGFPSEPPPANVTVSILITGVGPDFDTTVATFTSPTQAELSAGHNKIIPAGTPVTITTTTTTGTGGFGPYEYSGNKWNLQNHIQFQWVDYSPGPGTYSGSDAPPCDLSDLTESCVGITQLWK